MLGMKTAWVFRTWKTSVPGVTAMLMRGGLLAPSPRNVYMLTLVRLGLSRQKLAWWTPGKMSCESHACRAVTKRTISSSYTSYDTTYNHPLGLYDV